MPTHVHCSHVSCKGLRVTTIRSVSIDHVIYEVCLVSIVTGLRRSHHEISCFKRAFNSAGTHRCRLASHAWPKLYFLLTSVSIFLTLKFHAQIVSPSKYYKKIATVADTHRCSMCSIHTFFTFCFLHRRWL